MKRVMNFRILIAAKFLKSRFLIFFPLENVIVVENFEKYVTSTEESYFLIEIKDELNTTGTCLLC